MPGSLGIDPGTGSPKTDPVAPTDSAPTAQAQSSSHHARTQDSIRTLSAADEERIGTLIQEKTAAAIKPTSNQKLMSRINMASMGLMGVGMIWMAVEMGKSNKKSGVNGGTMGVMNM